MTSLAERISDRINPILVKEVRQALRGRLFRFGYGFTLLAATCTSLMVLMADHDGSDEFVGAALAAAIFACLLAGILSFVPFSAFMSMGGEWDENTYDLLVLSNLSPRRIVLGKLGSAIVQQLLCVSAFAPFFVFAFLLRGVNLPSLLLLLGTAIVVSPCVSLVALGLSSLGGNRFLRVLLMVALSASLLGVTIAGIGFAAYALAAQAFAPTFEQLSYALGAIVTVGLSLGLFFGELACVRLAHPEENRSTGLRLTLLAVLLGALAWAAVAMSFSRDRQLLSAIAIAVAFLAVLPCASFASEPERLGRRVTTHVPRNPVLALLVAPFLPGGGRGMLFWLVFAALGFVGLGIVHAIWIGSPLDPGTLSLWGDDGLLSAGLAVCYGTLYVGLPTLIASGHSQSLRIRVLARAGAPLLAFASIVVPSLLLFFDKGANDEIFEHWLNPIWMIDTCFDGTPARGAQSGVVLGFVSMAVLVALNAPRMLRGVREVLEASAARRARELEAIAKAAPAPARDASPAA